MQSHERCSVVEVMGRHAGYLALYVGIAVGATAFIPERTVDFERDIAEKIRRARLAGTTHFMVVVAEAPAVPRKSETASGRKSAWIPVSPFWDTSSGAVLPPPGTGRPPAVWAMRQLWF